MTVFNPRLSDDYLKELEIWEETRKDFGKFVEHVKANWYQCDTNFTVYLGGDNRHYAYTDKTKTTGFEKVIARYERNDDGHWVEIWNESGAS